MMAAPSNAPNQIYAAAVANRVSVIQGNGAHDTISIDSGSFNTLKQGGGAGDTITIGSGSYNN
jgi:hypothetical protein